MAWRSAKARKAVRRCKPNERRLEVTMQATLPQSVHCTMEAYTEPSMTPACWRSGVKIIHAVTLPRSMLADT